MNRVSSDVDNVDNVVTGTLTTIITNVVMILTTVVAMFIWNWRLAVISLIVVPFMILPLGPVGRACTTFARRRASSATRSSRSRKRPSRFPVSH